MTKIFDSANAETIYEMKAGDILTYKGILWMMCADSFSNIFFNEVEEKDGEYVVVANSGRVYPYRHIRLHDQIKGYFPASGSPKKFVEQIKSGMAVVY